MKNSKNKGLIIGVVMAIISLTTMSLKFGSPGERASRSKEDGEPLPTFVQNGVYWLARAQYGNGGWGAGSHAQQNIRDPKAVQVDPGTTAFAAMALIRAGNDLQKGAYSVNVNSALEYLLGLVERSPEEGVQITDIRGTQPQVKLGQNIDVSLTAQFFTKALPLAKHDASLESRIKNALQKCVRKIEKGQGKDGSWSGAGWAGVLQSAVANNALEMADDLGLDVDAEVLKNSKEYQRSNLNLSGTGALVRTDKAAGIP